MTLHRRYEHHDPSNPACGYTTSIGVASPDADWCSCPIPHAVRVSPEPGAPSDIVARAIRFAAAAHEGQRYPIEGGPDLPFLYHLAQVAEVGRRFGLAADAELAASFWLHDVLEDTDVAPLRVASEFGDRVLALVWAVTDHDGRGSAWYRASVVPDAPKLKLCDRIANVEASPPGGRHHTRYLREHASFQSVLYRSEHAALWKHLDRLLGLD